MKKQLARAALAAALLCGTAAVLTPAYAADQKVSHDVGVALNDAIKAAQGKDYAAATAALQKADAVSDKSDYDNYKINEIKAFVAVKQADYPGATADYEAMIASPVFATVDPKEQQQSLHNGLLLSGQSQHWPQVISDGQQLEKLNGMDAKTYTVLAQGYYFTNDFANAEQAAKKAIDTAKAAGQQPDQAALEIVMSAQAKSNNQTGAEQTLEQLAVAYGRPEDWSQLIEVALGTRGLSDIDYLYLYRLLFLSGATATGNDYADAAHIAIHLGYPAEALADLNQGIQSGKLSAGKAGEMEQARSGKRVDEATLKQIAAAAEKSKAGEQDVKLAEDYWGYGRYADAEQAAQRAISKGGLKDPGEGQFVLGLAQIAQGKYADGQATLAKLDSPQGRGKVAHLWILWAQSKSKPAPTQTPPATAPQQ
jgi:hypothetical protein